MNNLKTNPVGIDVHINSTQIKLFDKLGYTDFDGYGRIYTIEKKPYGFVLNEDYKELLTDDKLSGHFFFVENPLTDKDKLFITEIDIVFMLNLKKLKPNIIHRADEEVRIQILEILDNCAMFQLKSVTKGIDALSDFDHTLLDMQPYHFIKFSGEMQYNLQLCN